MSLCEALHERRPCPELMGSSPERKGKGEEERGRGCGLGGGGLGLGLRDDVRELLPACSPSTVREGEEKEEERRGKRKGRKRRKNMEILSNKNF
jgi:hypothetical protein